MTGKLADMVKQKPENPTPRILIYGPGGIGKSSFGADAPEPIFLDLEKGIDQLDAPRIDLSDANYAQILDALTMLIKDEHSFKTLVVDSLDWLESRIHTEIATKAGKKSIADIGYNVGFQQALVLFERFIKGTEKLRLEKGMEIIFISHAQVIKHEDPLNPPYDRFVLKLHKLTRSFIKEHVDALLFANLKSYVTTVEKSFNQDVRRATTGNERVIYTSEHPAYEAKNRFNLPLELPLSYQAFKKSLNPTKQGA